jgi:site-specific recombinase XerD
MNSFEKLVEGYLNECRSRSVNESTIRIREKTLLKWGVWLRTSGLGRPIADVNAEVILKFLKTDSVFKAKSTVAGTMSTLRCFGEYLSREGIWKMNYLRWMPSPKIRVGKHVPKAFKKVEVERMLAETFNHRDRLHQYLWPALFLCLYSLGLRRNELLRLDLADWNAKEQTLRVSSTKSGWDRYLPLAESVSRALEAYLPARHRVIAEHLKLDQPALFVNRSGERLSAMSCSIKMKKIALKSGLESFHVHQLRHTCATQLLENGVPLPTVKMVLGHACIETTVRYVEVSGPERRKAMDLHPINQILEVRP